MRLLIALVVVLGTACVNKAPDLSTPQGAAHCQALAIKNRDTTQWVSCYHPNLREQVQSELSKTALDWDRIEGNVKVFESATESDFAFKDVPAEQAEWGDKSAALELGEDDLVLVRSGGQWYILDSGL